MLGLKCVLFLFVSLVVVGCASPPSPFDGRLYPATATDSLNKSSSYDNKPIRSLPPKPTIDDLLAFAALNNAGLEAAYERWQASLEKLPQARALPDPRVTYRYFIENIETRVGPQRHKVGLAQSLPWFGKLDLREGIVAEQAQAAYADYQARKLHLFQHIRVLYIEYFFLGQAISVVDQNQQLVTHLEEVARARFKAAAGGHPDVLKAQVELGKLDDRLASLRAKRDPIRARLNAALGRSADAPLQLPGKLDTESLKLEKAELIRHLRDHNPLLLAAKYRTSAARLGIKLSKTDYYPDVAVGIDYFETGRAASPAVTDSGKDAVAAGFSVSIPIGQEKYDAAVRESASQFGAAMKSRTQLRRDLEAELETVLFDLQDAQRKQNLYEKTLVPKAKQSIGTFEASFRVGKASFTDLIDAQRLLLALELSSVRSVADHAVAMAKLEHLIGRYPTHLPKRRSKEIGNE